MKQACHTCGRGSDQRYCPAHRAGPEAARRGRWRPGRGTKADDELRLATFERDGFACVQCGSTENLERDHVVPVAADGPNTLENSQTLCRSCNRRKGATVE